MTHNMFFEGSPNEASSLAVLPALRRSCESLGKYAAFFLPGTPI